MRRRGRVALAIGLITSCVAVGAEQATERLSVYVGPEIKDGFVNVDGGINDSIKDIQAELRRSSTFAVARSRETADLVLVVVGRRVAGSAGAAAVPAGTSTLVFPIDRHAIDSVVHVGDHEKRFLSEDNGNGTWRFAARQVVKDLTVWVNANREAIAAARR